MKKTGKKMVASSHIVASNRMVMDLHGGLGDAIGQLKDLSKDNNHVHYLHIRRSTPLFDDGPFITGNTFAASEDNDALIRLFTTIGRRLPNLTTFILSDLNPVILPATCLTVLLQQCHSLTTLRMDAIRPTGSPSDFTMLADAFRQHPALTEVGFSGGCLLEDPQSGPSMAKAMAQIQTLSIVEIYLTSSSSSSTIPSVSSTEASPLSCAGKSLGALCSSNSLQVLRVRGVRVLQDQDIILMAQALHTNQAMKELWVLCCELGRKGVKAVAQMLQVNSSLQVLGLNRLLCNEHAILIAEGLRSNQTLRGLHLCLRDGGDGNEPPNQSRICESYVTLLKKHNFVLEKMSGGFVRGGAHTNVAVEQVDFYLRLNQSGRQFLLQNGNAATREQWVDAMCLQKEDANALFYWLSCNPSLCHITAD